MRNMFKFVQDLLVGREEPSEHKVVQAEKRVESNEERLRILAMKASVKSRRHWSVR